MSTQTEAVEEHEECDEKVEFVSPPPVVRSMRPAASSMRPAASHVDRSLRGSRKSAIDVAEVMADTHLKEELRAMARKRGVATSGAKFEIAMQMQRLCHLCGGRRD